METQHSDNFQLSLTALCQDMIETAINSRDAGDALRVGVKTSGCNGFSYIMEFSDKSTPVSDEDIVFNFEKVKIVSDKKSLLILTGLQIDYIQNGMNQGFDFINPNAKNECGCGESFNV